MTDEMFKPEWRPHPVLQTPHLAFFPLTLQKSRMVEGYRCYRGKDRTGTSTLQPRECHPWVTSCDEVFDTQGFSISGCSSSTELPSGPFCSPHSRQMCLPHTSCKKQKLSDTRLPSTFKSTHFFCLPFSYYREQKVPAPTDQPLPCSWIPSPISMTSFMPLSPLLPIINLSLWDHCHYTKSRHDNLPS